MSGFRYEIPREVDLGRSNQPRRAGLETIASDPLLDEEWLTRLAGGDWLRDEAADLFAAYVNILHDWTDKIGFLVPYNLILNHCEILMRVGDGLLATLLRVPHFHVSHREWMAICRFGNTVWYLWLMQRRWSPEDASDEQLEAHVAVMMLLTLFQTIYWTMLPRIQLDGTPLEDALTPLYIHKSVEEFFASEPMIEHNLYWGTGPFSPIESSRRTTERFARADIIGLTQPIPSFKNDDPVTDEPDETITPTPDLAESVSELSLDQTRDLISDLCSSMRERHWTFNLEILVMLLWRRFADITFNPHCSSAKQSDFHIENGEVSVACFRRTEITLVRLVAEGVVIPHGLIHNMQYAIRTQGSPEELNTLPFGLNNQVFPLQRIEHARIVTTMHNLAADVMYKKILLTTLRKGAFAPLVRPGERQMSIIADRFSDRQSITLLKQRPSTQDAEFAAFMIQTNSVLKHVITSMYEDNIVELIRQMVQLGDKLPKYTLCAIINHFQVKLIFPWVMYCIIRLGSTQNAENIRMIFPGGTKLIDDPTASPVDADEYDDVSVRFCSKWGAALPLGTLPILKQTLAAVNADVGRAPYIVLLRGEYWVIAPGLWVIHTRVPFQALKWYCIISAFVFNDTKIRAHRPPSLLTQWFPEALACATELEKNVYITRAQ